MSGQPGGAARTSNSRPETSVRGWSRKESSSPRSSVGSSEATAAPAHVDRRMLDIAEAAGVRLVNKDRMRHYTEGLQNWNPIWPNHGIRILPGPSSMWFDALGRRLPGPGLPGYDTLGTLKLPRTTPDTAQFDHSWFILTQTIIEHEFALSGSEQNPDIANHDLGLVIKSRLGRGAPPPVEAFKEHGDDFVVSHNLADLVAQMNHPQDPRRNPDRPRRPRPRSDRIPDPRPVRRG